MNWGVEYSKRLTQFGVVIRQKRLVKMYNRVLMFAVFKQVLYNTVFVKRAKFIYDRFERRVFSARACDVHKKSVE